ncbi:MAG TPA: efflux transporter outer membrane subunit [Burkholderiaceae bacterium]|nr:efflux transporter outer membrane subunit [Burkholderiaceae bacterium]
MRLSRTLLAAAIAVALTACASTDTRVPEVELPPANAATVAGIDRWWTQFNDPQLTALIEETLAANLDLRIAVARIEEARANLRLARSYQLPAIDADAGAARARRSDATEPRFPGPLITNSYGAGLNVAYEVDLWGRLSAGTTAAQSTLLGTRYNAETVRTVLAAQMASAYFQLLTYDAELRLSRDTLATRVESVNLQKDRFDAGLIGDYELRLAEAERATVAASVPPLQRAVAQTEAAIAVLAGRSARAVFTPSVARSPDLKVDDAGPIVPEGLPSDLLARRPDIRQAEADLVAANARITEARAQYFPAISLTARLGSESSELGDLFSGPALVWSVAGSVFQPVFGAGRIASQVEAATSRREQAEYAYVRSVQGAFLDAHDALVAHRTARDSYVAQEDRRAQFAEALRLAEMRYTAGYTSYIEVLDNQRNLLDAERARLLALRARQSALVDLYKALGGGWSPEQFAQR